MSLKLSDKVIEFLSNHPEEKFTAREIANWIFEKYPDECEEKKQRSKAASPPIDSDIALIQQLIAEIGSQRPILQKKDNRIKTTEERPRKYYLTSKSAEEEVSDANEFEMKKSSDFEAVFSEKDLYPKLSDFLLSEHEVFSMRIEEKKSRNSRGSNGNKWLHPDIVGVEDLSKNWHSEINDCATHYGDYKTRLWSFEVKKFINSSNVRECFFQTVSNSSWANFGYLVANTIQGDALEELRVLSGLHGIGVMRLDEKNPSESEIVIPAKERLEINWNNANRLAEENPDFLNYIKNIRQFYQTGEIRPVDWHQPQVIDE